MAMEGRCSSAARGIAMTANAIAILKYDGRWTWITGENRQWTILNHWIDRDGADRFRGSFSLQGLKELGIIK
jgi:hypothetical protein